MSWFSTHTFCKFRFPFRDFASAAWKLYMLVNQTKCNCVLSRDSIKNLSDLLSSFSTCCREKICSPCSIQDWWISLVYINWKLSGLISLILSGNSWEGIFYPVSKWKSFFSSYDITLHWLYRIHLSCLEVHCVLIYG